MPSYAPLPVPLFAMSAAPQKKAVSRGDVLRLAADTGLDVRTVKRALERGAHVLHAEVARERFVEAAKRLGINLSVPGAR
jgi:hypothetical protein